VATIDKNITQNQENVNQVYRAYMMMLLQIQIKDIKLLPMLDQLLFITFLSHYCQAYSQSILLFNSIKNLPFVQQLQHLFTFINIKTDLSNHYYDWDLEEKKIDLPYFKDALRYEKHFTKLQDSMTKLVSDF
jgi:hypothetical protein